MLSEDKVSHLSHVVLTAIKKNTGTKVKSNQNSNNTGNEFTIGTGNVDQGSNKKNGSSFTFTSAGGNFN